jgi:uncharacterized protein YwqG
VRALHNPDAGWSDMSETKFAPLLEKYRQPAIMIHRPYPPLNLKPVNSHLGGRPNLPAGIDWPRTGDGIPLHFLAQIDCAELPQTDGLLPDSGVLFFFAHMDDDMNWGEGDPADDARVVFTSNPGEKETDPPNDLPEILYEGVQLYPCWPVTFHPVDSWPDPSGVPVKWQNSDYEAYYEAVKELRLAEKQRVAGPWTKLPYFPRWRKEIFWASDPDFHLPDSPAGRPFPQVWVLLERIACHVLKCAAQRMWLPPEQKGPDPALLEPIRSTAANWVATARRHPLDTAPDAETSRAFAAWLQNIADQKFFREKAAAALIKGMKSAIQFAAAHPRAAALLPEIYYQECHERRQIDIHQMLGNARSSQAAPSVERDEILLLKLMSDDGVNFMFCDLGEIEFWIKPDDLKARRFDKVVATTQGG